MLEKLNEIDWKARHVEELPNHIRNLASDDVELCTKASEYIEEKILYGGINFQDVDRGYGISSILASDIPHLMLPFLIELLTYEQVETKAAILSMLQFIAEYVHFHYEGEIYLDHAKQLRQAVSKENNIYLSLLNDTNASVRFAAFNMLSSFREYAQDLLTHLLETIQAESQAETKTLMMWYLRNLSTKNNTLDPETKYRLTNFLRELIVPIQDYSVRITAAIVLIHFLKAEAPFEAIDSVVQAMIYESDPPPPAHLLALRSNEQAKSILELGVEKGFSAAIEVIKHTKHVENGYYAMMAALILAFTPEAFPEYGIIKTYGIGAPPNVVTFIVEENFQPHPNLQALNSLQKTVIETIVKTDWIWGMKSNVLEIFKLPTKRDALSKLLSDA